MKIGLAHRGSFSGHTVLPIISQTMELYNTTYSTPLQRHLDHFFTIPIPSEVEITGQMTPTPPSFFALHQNVSCEIQYELRFRMMRKGKGLKRSETQVLCSVSDILAAKITYHRKNIKIFYLPKSRPSEPPLTAIPRPSRNFADRSALLGMFERVKTVALLPYQSAFCKTKACILNLTPFHDAIYVSGELKSSEPGLSSC